MTATTEVDNMDYTNLKELARLEEIVKPMRIDKLYRVTQTLYVQNGKPGPALKAERGWVISKPSLDVLKQAYEDGKLYVAAADWKPVCRIAEAARLAGSA